MNRTIVYNQEKKEFLLGIDKTGKSSARGPLPFAKRPLDGSKSKQGHGGDREIERMEHKNWQLQTSLVKLLKYDFGSYQAD